MEDHHRQNQSLTRSISLLIGIEPASLSTAPVGTKGRDKRVWRLRCVSDGKSTLGDNGGVHQAEWSSPSQNRAELSMGVDIEPPSLSTAPVETKGGDTRLEVEVCLGWKRHP